MASNAGVKLHGGWIAGLWHGTIFTEGRPTKQAARRVSFNAWLGARLERKSMGERDLWDRKVVAARLIFERADS
jgi:hypothetical protein